MRDYGKVFSSFWTSQTIRAMDDDARTLAIYLLTCPHGTISGVFRLPDGYVCDDLNWEKTRVIKAFDTLSKGFANRCETTKWVWINKHFDWNKPENPLQLKGAKKIALTIPDECSWKLYYMSLYAGLLDIQIKPFTNPLETLSKPVAVAVAVTVAETVEVAETEQTNKTKTKSADKSAVELLPIPDFVDAELWQDFIELRKGLKAKNTLPAIKALIIQLKKIKDAGSDPEEAIRTSIRSSWKDIYAPNPDRRQNVRDKGSIAEQNKASTEAARIRLFGNMPTEKEVQHATE